MLRISWLFVSLGIPTQIRFGSQNGGNYLTKIWLRYKIFRKFTQLWALQNLIFIEKYRKSFHESELGRLHSAFPFERMAKTMGFSEQRLGRRNIFSPSAKIAQDYQKRLSIIRKVLVQEKDLFEGRKVSDRIVSIDRHYVRPIVRGKEIKGSVEI